MPYALPPSIHEAYGVSNLNFTAFAGLNASDGIKDCRRQYIAGRDRQLPGASDKDGFSMRSSISKRSPLFLGLAMPYLWTSEWSTSSNAMTAWPSFQ